ncbi:MAG: hypothetical protein M1837_004168 [Sclerophora amabilis]|nr:MAG: hypothetical protein M1837_004168 [Sclerophora amabilis]
MAPPHIITIIGSLNTDLVTRTSRVPSAGETLIAQSFDTGSGGKGANQAVACARLSRTKASVVQNKKRKLGSDDEGSSVERSKASSAEDVVVKMVGAVGDDVFGRPLVAGLEEDGIDVSGVRVSESTSTGVACIIVDETTGDNRILVTPGANYLLRPEQFRDLPPPLPALFVLQLEIPLDTVLEILQLASSNEVAVLLNPAPATELPDEAYKAITHLIVNKSEAAILSGIAEEEVVDERIDSLAADFIRRGVQNVVITLGGQGAFFKQQGGTTGRCAAEKVDVVDTTAAGDTFAGAYAIEAAKATGGEFMIDEAVQRASKAAAYTVQRKGAQSAIPWLNEAFPAS